MVMLFNGINIMAGTEISQEMIKDISIAKVKFVKKGTEEAYSTTSSIVGFTGEFEKQLIKMGQSYTFKNGALRKIL